MEGSRSLGSFTAGATANQSSHRRIALARSWKMTSQEGSAWNIDPPYPVRETKHKAMSEKKGGGERKAAKNVG